MNTKIVLKTCSWLLAIVVTGFACVVWAGERLSGNSLSLYDLFPLLGLLAFSLMWTHYILGSLRRCLKLSAHENKLYMKLTNIAVLMLIVLHPGLLILQLYKDGLGLPPNSYLQVYTGPVVRGALVLGTIALIIFILFESKKWLQKTKWWKFVEYAQILAMIFIFYHGLTLGRELSVEWYRVTWWCYGASFLGALIYNYRYDIRIKERDGRHE